MDLRVIELIDCVAVLFYDDNSDNNDINYSKLTIPQLKEILRNNNCKVGGNKTALIERILSEKNKNLDLWKN